MTEARRTDQQATDAGPSDAELVARWRLGDQRGAWLLVERHADSIARFVIGLGERSGVEELVQDTFVRAFASIDRFRGESTLRTWLFAIARNIVRDRARAARRRPRTVPVEPGHAITEYTGLDGVLADESGRRLRAAVEGLTPTQREVFTLRVAEGLSYREIAQVVGTTEGAARVHYHDAMRAVKEYLDE